MVDLFCRDRRPHIKQEGISVGQHEISESRDALTTQELQGSRARGRQPLRVATCFVGEMLSEPPTSGQPPIKPGGDLAHTREHGLQREDLWVGQGNGTFPWLTHLLEGDRGQAGRDWVRTRERGGGSPRILPMSSTRNRKETMYSLVFHKLGQSRVSVL